MTIMAWTGRKFSKSCMNLLWVATAANRIHEGAFPVGRTRLIACGKIKPPPASRAGGGDWDGIASSGITPRSSPDAADKPPGDGEQHSRLDQQHGSVHHIGIGYAEDRRLVVTDGTGEGGV